MSAARGGAGRRRRLRLRPILMTSLAFIVGVLPLAISTGAGAGSQNDIGTGVVGGMLSATVLAIFFVPLFFIVVKRLFRQDRRRRRARRAGAGRIARRRADAPRLRRSRCLAPALLAGCIDLAPGLPSARRSRPRRPSRPGPAYPPPRGRSRSRRSAGATSSPTRS